MLRPSTPVRPGVQEGVTAVLTASATDVLSHVAIRARSQKVLLATCFDATELSSLKAREGAQATLVVDAAGMVTVAESAGKAQVPPPSFPACPVKTMPHLP